MLDVPFRVQREPFFTAVQLENIEEAAIRLLTDVGVKIPDDDLRGRVSRAGFAISGDRARFERGKVAGFIDGERERNGRSFSQASAPSTDEPITLGVSQYSQNHIDLDTGAVRPITYEALVEATKLVDALADRGVRAGAPGTPMDVPPDLQPVAIYYASLTHTRHGRRPLDPRSVPGHRYVLEMADAVGYELDGLPVYLVSPLTLAGDSLAAVLEYADRIDTVWVLSMPSVGATAPIRVGDALALAAAEVIGSAMILQEILPHEVRWGTEIFPFDLRHMSMVFGSPENMLFQLATAEVAAYLHGEAWAPWAANIHTMAKEPGPQAAAEKSSIMTAGALLGARNFSHGGTLSLDEIFSAEQLVIDCEIRDHTERLLRGIDPTCDADACVEDVQQGIERGFMGLDRTLDAYRDVYWHPTLFERSFLGAWRENGAPALRDRAQQTARQLIDGHEFAQPDHVQRELDRIWQAARRDLG